MAQEFDARPGRRLPRWPGGRLVAVATAVCAALVGVAVVPAHGAEPAGGSAPVVGDFAVGDGLEGLIDEESGSFGVTLTVGGLDVRWDSRAAAAGDRFGLGDGWGYQLGFVDTDGGTRLVPPSWGEVFEADASARSGLRGYTLEDLRFRRLEADAIPALPAAAFVVHELGGTSTYFSAAGDPVAAVSRHGEQTTWEWSGKVPHRLERVVDADGVVTTLDWESEQDTLIVRRGVNLAVDADEPDRAWRVRFDVSGAIAAVVDPTGERTEFGYQDAQLSTISNAAGARTRIDWRAFDDGVPRVRRVSTSGPGGQELSARTWDRFGAALPSGWPLLEGMGATYGAGGSADARFRTTLSDGVSSVRSEYSVDGVLRSRDVVVDGAAGERMLRRQVFEYPEVGEAGVEAGGAGGVGSGPVSGTLRSRPIAATSVRFNVSGASRDERESFEYDPFGRPVRQVAADGAVTETSFDDQAPVGRELPVGLVTRRMVTTADGLIRGEVSTLDEARAAVIATETLSVAAGAAGPVVTGRTEFEVEPDGFVSERRIYPSGDSGLQPAVTRWSERVDLAAGASTTVETTGVGTAAEASASRTVSLLHGGVLATRDVFGQAATSAFDAAGRVIAATDVAGRTVRSAYESWQREGRNATVVTGADGVVTTEVRDALGRVVTRTDNIDHGVVTEGHVRVVESMDHDVPGTVTVTDAWGASVSVSKDAFGREVRRVGPTGLVEASWYDDVADEVSTGATPTGDLADAESVTVRRLDRGAWTTSTSTRRHDGVVTPDATETVDGFGRPVTASDGFVRSTAAYDAFGRPASTTFASELAAAGDDAAGDDATGDGRAAASVALTATPRFDAFGNGVEKQLVDGTGQASGGSREVDALGRTQSETDRAGRKTVFEYTLDGLVSRASRSDGQVIVHEYDPRTRARTRTTTTSPTGETVDVGTAYDPVTGDVAAVFDPGDRAGTEIVFSYDAHGNQLTKTYPGGATVGHRYDAHGRSLTTTDPAGNVTEYDHDAAGLLIGAVQRDAGGAELARVSYEFDELDRLESLTRGNGVVTRYTYTSVGEIASETTTTSAGRPSSARSYTYDPRGLLIERVDTIPDDDGDERRTTSTYRYDERERLIASSVHDDQSRTETAYELSVAGDVTSEAVTEQSDGMGKVSTRVFEYTPGGELAAITTEGVRSEQAYDAAGNLTRTIDGTTFTYTAANRPLTETAPDGTTVTTTYWADGTRRSVSEDDADDAPASTEFVWDGTDLIAETHRTGETVTTAAYLLGADRHARTIARPGGPSTAYYGTDRHGNVTDLTTTDGDVTERYTYTDYGTETPRGAGGTATSPEAACTPSRLGDPTRNPFRYAGEYTDPTCRQHLAVRSYDAESMRFTSMDTAAVMNPYAYTDANPITRIDPTGNDWERDAAATTLNRLALATGVAGLLGSIIAFTAPLHPVIAVLTLVTSWADAVGVAAATVREVRPAWLTQSADDSLAMLDIGSGLAVVGIAAGAYAIWWRFIAGRATQAAARRTLRMFSADPPSSTRPPGSGSSTTRNLGSGRGRAPSAEGDETTESLLAGQSSAEPMPFVDLMQNVDPSDVPDVSTLLLRKEGHLHRTKSGRYEFLYPEIAVKPAASVVHTQPIPKHASKPVTGEIFSTPAATTPSNIDVLDAVTTTSKRWPGAPAT